MIWQEFPLACGNYEGSAAYLRVLDQESGSIIRRLRSRACVVLWCGGNELFNSWSRMTDQDLALRLLNRNTFRFRRSLALQRSGDRGAPSQLESSGRSR